MYNFTVIIVITGYNFEYVSMFTLGINSFTIMSVDGFYYRNFYAVVVDYWNGVLVLQKNNAKTDVIYNITYNKNDPIISIEVVYKGFI